MSSGRGGNNRRKPFKRRDRNNDHWQDNSPRGGKQAADSGRLAKTQGGFYERPRWTPPALSTDPLPAPDCPYCGKPISDISAAMTDKNTGEPVHFDCVINRIAGGEMLEPGDTVSYIGGGRFGVVHFNDSRDPQNFRIKKILEWENKENRAEWRRSISDHYSVT
jgi:hypothetical protein